MSAISWPEQKTGPLAGLGSRTEEVGLVTCRAECSDQLPHVRLRKRVAPLGRFMVMVLIPAAAETRMCSYPTAFPAVV